MSEPSAFLALLAQALDDAGVPFMLAGSFASSVHGAPRATQDIFRKARRFSRSELERRVTLTVLELRVPVASAEDTILAKLEWAKLGQSERQLRDVRGILDVRGDSIDRAYVERWLDELGVRDLWARVEQGEAPKTG